MAAKLEEPAADWIAFAAAGRLIDGPNGWTSVNQNTKRPRAEALLKFASEGSVRTKALKWTTCKDGKNHLEASPEDRPEF